VWKQKLHGLYVHPSGTVFWLRDEGTNISTISYAPV
jgi:hypothetical protein